MKMRTMVALALALALGAAPLAALAQGDETQWEDFVAQDERLTLKYPAGWFVSEATEGEAFPTVGILNSEEAATRFEEGGNLVPGDKGFSVIVLPLDFLALLGIEIPEGATTLEAVQAMSDLFALSGEDAAGDGSAASGVGEPEELDLAEDVPGVVVSYQGASVEGEYVVRLLENDLVLILVSAAAPGEFDDAQRALDRELAASVAYAGTGADLLAEMMAPAPTEAAPTEASPADSGAALDGAALVAERCTVCHTRERIDNSDKSAAGWTATVDRMIGNGAKLDSAERQAVIDYLVATH